MALATLTLVDHTGEQGGRPRYNDVIKMAGPASYTTGGDTGLLAALRALRGDGRRILNATCTCQRTITGTVISALTTKLYAWQYDPTNDTIQAFNTTSGAEASGSLASIQTEWAVESA